ncbi:uncharacterized protein UV8b_06575 [Ustilaginoidea virens]|uniref:Uncharacterized protein n=1 Tax=Ustilaginoidea virens TaxID=1159556 RepID=A0A8E5HW55_USTVR|nr:uncharacterized protein UV8b_06575 [Ustilaginoidea virens]QUC22334.1 hypothetical protein UV8b_06575 [Ustilaginoidea virens]
MHVPKSLPLMTSHLPDSELLGFKDQGNHNHDGGKAFIEKTQTISRRSSKHIHDSRALTTMRQGQLTPWIVRVELLVRETAKMASNHVAITPTRTSTTKAQVRDSSKSP